MGEKEDLVRAHLRDRQAQQDAEDERRRQERAEREAKTEQKFQKLVDQFSDEATRIAEILESADWSRATLRTFVWPKEHWWSRKQREEELACLPFFEFGGWLKFSVCSDGGLWVSEGHAMLFRPKQFFQNYTNQMSSEVLVELRAIKSLNDCNALPD